MKKRDASSGKVHVSSSPSRGRSDASPALIAGREVVGRKIAVWKPKAGIWRNGTVSDFSDNNLCHMVRYDERGAREEEWLNLGRSRFSWLSEPAVGCASNPTVVPGLTPTGKDAVDHKVKVFWPAMGRWYIGRVSAFDGKTGRHTVQFKDGDKRVYTLRHEAVVWLDVPGLNRTSRLEHGWHLDEQQAGAKVGTNSQPAQDRAVKRLTDTEQGSCSTGAHKGEGKRTGNAEPTSIAKRTRRSAQGATNPAKAVTSPCSEAHSQEYSHPARPVGSPPYRGQQADSPCHASKSAEPATTTFNAGGACNIHGSQNRGEEVGRPGHTPATSSSVADQEIDVVNLSSGNPDHGHSSCAGGKGALKVAAEFAKDAAARKDDEQSPQRTDSAGKRPAKRGGRPSKQLKRGGPRRSSSGLESSAVIDLGSALETIVGARVGVWWDEDETYYKGEITSFDSYHKRSKISYDDGEEMWVALQRETFTWITPRAFGAGANATMLGAMRFVGAKNAIAEPKQLNSAAEVCPGAHTPAVAVLPAVASSPSGAKVRQVSVASADGFAFGPIAACSAIEAARESAAQATNPRGTSAVGRRLSLTFTGDNSTHKGEVLAFDAEKGQHLVFYDDGEDEWVDLSLQHVTWQEHVRGVTVAHGLPAGTSLPKGKAAVGWRVAVYWRDDKAFYPAEIMGYDTATGRHEVEYDDGEEEEVGLSKEKVKWLMPPGVRGTAVSESDDYEGDDSDDEEEEEEDEEEALIRRNRRRGRSAQRRSARQARRRSPSDPLARSVRFRPSRFAREASTPPDMSPYARRQTAHGSLGLYPEDDVDGRGSMHASMRPILAPTRAEARPVFTREVSAERGVRLPGGSRLQGVTRVSIYLSEDRAYDAKPEAEKAGQPVLMADTGKPNATELLAIAEKLCERTAGKRGADLDRNAHRPRRGASVDMSVVMRRVAMARAEIADRDRFAQMADVEEDDDQYERSGVTVPVADASDHKAAQLATMASNAFLTPPSLPTPLAYPVSQAGVPTGQSCAGPGRSASQAAAQPDSATEELLTDAAGAAPPGAGEAPALWAAMRPAAHLHSPFSSPAIQMLPAGIADAAQRLMNGGAAIMEPAVATTAAPQQAAQAPGSSEAAHQLTGDDTAPSRTETVEAGTAETVQQDGVDAAASVPADARASTAQQLCNGHSSPPLTAAETGSPRNPASKGHTAMEASKEAEVALAATAPAGGESPADAAFDKQAGVDVTVQAAGQVQALRKLALLQQMNSSFSIPETPSLGDELRGGFKLPQHLDSLKMAAAAGSSCRVDGADNNSTPRSQAQAELDALPEGVAVAQ